MEKPTGLMGTEDAPAGPPVRAAGGVYICQGFGDRRSAMYFNHHLVILHLRLYCVTGEELTTSAGGPEFSQSLPPV